MNIINEIGSTFWRVEYKGVLTEYKIVDYKNNDPVYNIKVLTNLRNEEYKINNNPDVFGRSNFPLDIALNNPKEFFDNIEEAKKVSLNRFNKEVNPNGDYRVARYFDDIFEAYVTDVLSKNEAREKAKELNRKPRHYVYYDICAVKN